MKIMLAWLCIGIASFAALHSANPPVVRGVAIENNVARYMVKQPYTAALSAEKTGQLWVVINYTRGQNTSFVITPTPNKNTWQNTNCINQMQVANQHVNMKPICEETTLDLSPYLKEGPNGIWLELQAEQPEVAIYVYPKLFGSEIWSTAGCLGLFVFAAGFLIFVARKMGLDATSSGIAVLGLAYFSYWLYFWPNLLYTADLPGHLPYMMHMIEHWMQPYDYHGHEEFHPPLYYFIAARVFQLFDSGPLNPLTAVHVLSLGLYMLFCLYGLATLRLVAGKEGLVYYIGCALIMFWPAGIIKATNINNDVAIYTVWGASFYYMLRGIEERSIGYLQVAVALTGLAFMVKSNAWVPLGITGACALYGLYCGSWSWQKWFSARSLIAAFVLCLGIVINMGRVIYMTFFHHTNEIMNYFGYPREDVHPLSYFMHFDTEDFLKHTFITFDREPAFLNFFFKSMLYNEASWDGPHFLLALPWLLNILLLLWLAATISGVLLNLIEKQQATNLLYACIIATIVSVLASMTFTYIDRYVFCQNFRYVLPMLIPLVALFVRGMETARASRITQPLYWFGAATSVLFIAASVTLYLAQYVRF